MLLILLFLFILGTVFGSFASAYSYRWPRSITISKGRSFCPKCRTNISWYDNIPLLSFLLLGGKCRNCHKKISPRYPLIELFTGILFVLVYYATTVQGTSLHGANFRPLTTDYFLLFPYFLLLTTILVAIFVIDLENKLIPDETVFLIFALAAFNLIFSDSPTFWSVLFYSFLVSLSFLLLHLITKGKGMGLGDVKLVLALALVFAGWRYIVLWLFLSFVIGALVGVFLISIGKAKFGRQIPFGPFLILAFFITLFWGNSLVKCLLPYL